MDNRENELSKELDNILEALRKSEQKISKSKTLRKRFLEIYQNLLEHIQEHNESLSEEESYFFSVPQYMAYEKWLDEEILEFIRRGAAYTLPEGATCKREDIEALQEGLDELLQNA